MNVDFDIYPNCRITDIFHLKISVLTERIFSQPRGHFVKHVYFTATISDNSDFALWYPFEWN